MKSEKIVKWLTPEKALEKTLSDFIHSCLPGFVLGFVLLVFTLPGAAVGVRNAAHDLFIHGVFIHPFLLTLLTFVITFSVFAQGADFLKITDRWISLPILELLSHLLSVSAGAFIPLLIANADVFGTNWYVVGVKGMVVWLSIVGMGVLAAVGKVLVGERVKAAQLNTLENPFKVHGKLLWLYGGLAVISGVLLFYTGQMKDDAKKTISTSLDHLTNRLP